MFLRPRRLEILCNNRGGKKNKIYIYVYTTESENKIKKKKNQFTIIYIRFEMSLEFSCTLLLQLSPFLAEREFRGGRENENRQEVKWNEMNAKSHLSRCTSFRLVLAPPQEGCRRLNSSDDINDELNTAGLDDSRE